MKNFQLERLLDNQFFKKKISEWDTFETDHEIVGRSSWPNVCCAPTIKLKVTIKNPKEYTRQIIHYCTGCHKLSKGYFAQILDRFSQDRNI